MNLVMPGMELSDNAAESSRQASADGSDQQLVSGLYSDYEQMMYRVAFNILRSRADAEDAVQEAFIRVMGNLEKIRAVPCNERRFYLVIIVRNVSITMLNRRNRRTEVDIDEQYGAASDYSVEEEILGAHGVEEIRSAVMSLSREDSEVLYLFLFRELTPGEIAGLLGKKPASVRSRISRARKRLIDSLNRKGE